MENKYFVFNNVTITVDAATGKEAYTRLCEALEPFGFYETETFEEYTNENLTHTGSTSELFPETV